MQISRNNNNTGQDSALDRLLAKLTPTQPIVVAEKPKETTTEPVAEKPKCLPEDQLLGSRISRAGKNFSMGSTGWAHGTFDDILKRLGK